jgi:hypothetical protein
MSKRIAYSFGKKLFGWLENPKRLTAMRSKGKKI